MRVGVGGGFGVGFGVGEGLGGGGDGTGVGEGGGGDNAGGGGGKFTGSGLGACWQAGSFLKIGQSHGLYQALASTPSGTGEARWACHCASRSASSERALRDVGVDCGAVASSNRQAVVRAAPSLGIVRRAAGFDQGLKGLRCR